MSLRSQEQQSVRKLIQMVKKIYFVGIKGVGNAPLAIIAKQAGIEVAGSDTGEEFITDKYLQSQNIVLDNGFDLMMPEQFFGDSGKDECLVVTTGAHGGFDNPQSKWAKENGYKVLSQGQVLGEYMSGNIFGRNDIEGISVAASHGKTTITSLLSTALVSLGEDISYTIGTGEIFPLGSPGKYGKSKYFVAEADEYASEPVYDRQAKFLYQRPTYAIFNNIDFDHPDIFPTVDSVYEAFEEFSKRIKPGGSLILNGDDQMLRRLLENKREDITYITYGKNTDNDFVLSNFIPDGPSHFSVSKNGEAFGDFSLSLLGEYNALNSMSVIVLLSFLGFSTEDISNSVASFTGSKRRSEIVGKTKGGALLMDDYGHHPNEIAATLSAISAAYPSKKIVVIFQPHTFSRTKSLLNDFANSFSSAEQLILMPVFKSARDTEKDTLTDEEYVSSHKAKVSNTLLLRNEADVVEYVGQNFNNDSYIIVTMGAGDVYKIAYLLKEI